MDLPTKIQQVEMSFSEETNKHISVLYLNCALTTIENNVHRTSIKSGSN